MRDKPFYFKLKECVPRFWTPICSLKFFLWENSLSLSLSSFHFLVKMELECDRILQLGLLIIWKDNWYYWNSGLNQLVSRGIGIVSSASVWAHFLNLHYKHLSLEVLSRLASKYWFHSSWIYKVTTTDKKVFLARYFIELIKHRQGASKVCYV